MKTILIIPTMLLTFISLGCHNATPNGVNSKEIKSTIPKSSKPTDLDKYATAYFASGCFWCVEAIFESVEGVKEAISGYAGGDEKNPTYGQVSSGNTGHTETVKVYYDSTVISYETLLKVYYGSHNPTTVNGQSPDFGTQYRSAIFYTNNQQKKRATTYKDSLDKANIYNEPIATEISKLKTFWKAEEYHQDYEKRNLNQPYVKSVSIPRLNKFKAKYPALLKKETH